MIETQTEVDRLLQRASAGDDAAWGALLTQHEDRLCRTVNFRLDVRLQGRIDAADVVQEAYVEATAHRSNYFRQPDAPVFLWLRGIVSNKLLEIHRRHLGTHKRDAAREVSLHPRAAWPTADVTSIAIQLMGHATGPGTAAGRAEVGVRLHSALNGMDSIDREVLTLRHFEQLSSSEAAKVLGIQERAAAKRYVRALERLKDILAKLPGGLTGLDP